MKTIKVILVIILTLLLISFYIISTSILQGCGGEEVYLSLTDKYYPLDNMLSLMVIVAILTIGCIALLIGISESLILDRRIELHRSQYKQLN